MDLLHFYKHLQDKNNKVNIAIIHQQKLRACRVCSVLILDV